MQNESIRCHSYALISYGSIHVCKVPNAELSAIERNTGNMTCVTIPPGSDREDGWVFFFSFFSLIFVYGVKKYPFLIFLYIFEILNILCWISVY